MSSDGQTPDIAPEAEATPPAPEPAAEPAAEVTPAESSTQAEPTADAAPAEDAPGAEAPAREPQGDAPVGEGDAKKPSLSQIKRLQSGHGPKRRRKPSAAQRHRGLFFARLNELRRAERGGPAAADPAEAPAPEEQVSATPAAEPEAPVEDATPETPAAEVPAAESSQETPAEPEAAPAPEEPAAETVAEAQAETPAEPVADAPAAEAPADRPSEAPAAQARSARTPPPPLEGIAIARVQAAISRVGGPDAIKEALAPQQDANGQPLKWAAVCAEKSIGLKPGDPVFQAWLRLAATPVREVKGQLRALTGEEDRERGRGRGGRSGERGGGGRREGRGGGGRRDGGPQGGRGPGRAPRSDRPASAEELRAMGRDGSLSSKVRIVADKDDEKREREKARKAAKEAKRQAERERLSRLGY
ncbi:MAG: hypothetical protein ACSLFR_02220 [Solirubrobacteraceae bacterium]